MNLIFEEDAYFDCHSSGKCCRENWSIPVERSKVDRLRQVGPPLAIVQESGGIAKLGRESGVCTFLNDNNLCRVHAELGSDSKPNACQLFPFVVYPAPDGLHIGVSHFCPSARGRKGRPIKTHEPTLRRILDQMVFGSPSESAVLKDREPLGWTAYRSLEVALLERLNPEPIQALLGLHRGLTTIDNWWNRDISDLFLTPDVATSRTTETRATALAERWKLELATAPQGGKAAVFYLKSLIRRKYLHRREFLDGLESLAIVHFVVCRSLDKDATIELLESYLTHTRAGTLPDS